jgi:hypothetical protein
VEKQDQVEMLCHLREHKQSAALLSFRNEPLETVGDTFTLNFTGSGCEKSLTMLETSGITSKQDNELYTSAGTFHLQGSIIC